MDSIVFYHDGTVEGRLSACVVRMALGNRATYVPAQYHNLDNVLSQYDWADNDVYICGLDIMANSKLRIGRPNRLVYIAKFEQLHPMFDSFPDTRIVNLNNRPTNCAQEIWAYFRPDDPVPAFFQHVTQFDPMDMSYSHAQMIALSLFSKTQDELFFLVSNPDDTSIGILYSEGIIQQRFFTWMAEHNLISKIGDYDSCLGRIAFGNISKIFVDSVWSKLRNEYDLLLTYEDFKSDRAWSLRSSQTDVEQLALKMGGSGSPTRSGFKTSALLHVSEVIARLCSN